ncbi:MAG: hypothetical protein F9K44_06295 [Hyphomicrobiaceae bacterium]|nr:MAG: hypothetical protein F9K44_06295 [Hyphomicrobiaceae bacterium]
MKGQKIPPEHHVVRYVPWGKLRKDENDNVLGVLGEAFRLRPNESALSTTWLEYFAGNRSTRVTAAIKAIRASNLKPGGKSGFAVGNVAAITTTCANRHHKIRIVHEPENDNQAHTSVRRFPREDPELLELLAIGAWSELALNTNVAPGAKRAPDEPEAV